MTEVELRQAIADALKRFDSESLGNASTHLLDVLGYASTKRIALKPNTLANFLSMFSHGRALNDRYALPDEWKSVDFLFQLTDEEVRTSTNQQYDFESKGAYNGAIINSYLFFAIELKGSHYSRTTLAGITREVNKLFDMPALVLFRHGETLTLAIINRRLHKREAGKDVLEKVTLIHDIQLTSTHRAHIDILTDLSLSFLHRRHPFTNFVELHEAWQKTLDTSELNKRFFQDLANWYFWALPQVRFPKNAPKDADGQDSLSLIRLITRVIFCWFLKEKGLLPEALFDEHTVPALLTNLSPKESTYYKAILQNLFFATLNQEMDKREFRKSGQNFMAHNLYRYKNLLKNPGETMKLLEGIPFMNGGLFECLDKTLGTKDKPQYIRIDGFSDRDDNILEVPNDLFWGPELVVDLSEAYGESRFTSSKVAGLVRIFNRYKFTVAENTPIEEEVALDPELLGRVFENLLAAYNPETGATARKQTGSFYTPREIVNYMVDESLIASLKTKLTEALPKAEKTEERLRKLFAYNDQAHEFAEPEVVEIIKGIDRLTILDPACGSGAFPMGILHKLVFVLSKLDPGNLRWKARQLAKAEEIPDSTVRERVLADIEESFNANELDYGRKLYLIENCIYGVDIQPIAVQISKLRFFISLVVEQTVHLRTENRGIRPLPNLETKFVAANALVGIQRPGQQLLRDLDVQAKEAELRQVRERHFLARTPATKTKYREQDATLRAELAEMLKHDGWDSATAKMLAGWDPYDQNASASFFDSEWMFGMLVGFDVVIANPPYIQLSKIDSTPDWYKQYLRDRYQTSGGRLNTFIFFIHLGIELLQERGILTYIIPNTILTQEYYSATRELLLRGNRLRTVVQYSGQVFQNAVVENVTIVASKECISQYSIQILNDSFESDARANQMQNTDFLANPKFSISVNIDEIVGSIFAREHQTLGSLCEVNQAIALIGDRSLSLKTTNPGGRYYKVIDGRNIGRYSINWDGVYLDHRLERIHSCKRKDIFESREKLFFRRVSERLMFAYDDQQYFALNTLVVVNLKAGISLHLKYLLALLNSKLMDYLYKRKFKSTKTVFSEIQARTVMQLPIAIAKPNIEARLIALVDAMINLKQDDVDADVTEQDHEIDRIVYKLYRLSDTQVECVENATV
jgi:adenine-specific DNA-methyltransferase